MKFLITGGCGFLGSNLSSEILKRGDELCIFDSLYRYGSEQNLSWLKTQGEFRFVHGDIRNQNDVMKAVSEFRPEVIFHLAGQVAMTTSIDNPRMDFEVNALGSLNLLEAARHFAPEASIFYSSTNKVYGDLEWTPYIESETRYIAPEFPDGFPESAPLEFHSPYGCSKGAADQYMLDYSRIYGLKTVVFRHSSMYGGRQFATVDQGWVGWFCQQALDIKRGRSKGPLIVSGNGKQVRDLLHAEDMVSLYLSGLSQIEHIAGRAFNIGGGMRNSLSLIELFSLLSKELDVQIPYQCNSARASDQKLFVADIRSIQEQISWQPLVDSITGVRSMLKWLDEVHDD